MRLVAWHLLDCCLYSFKQCNANVIKYKLDDFMDKYDNFMYKKHAWFALEDLSLHFIGLFHTCNPMQIMKMFILTPQYLVILTFVK